MSRFDPITLVFHGLFGMFLSSILWFFGLGGFYSWSRGHPNEWIDSKIGFLFCLLIGGVFGVVAGVFRDRRIVRLNEEQSEAIPVIFDLFVKVILPLLGGLGVIWILLR